MTADRDTLLALAEEVERATEASISLEHRIKMALQPSVEGLPLYTASIDAAYALLREVLPGWACGTWHRDGRPGYDADLMGPVGTDLGSGSKAPTLPLAICAAVLRAVAARGSSTMTDPRIEAMARWLAEQYGNPDDVHPCDRGKPEPRFIMQATELLQVADTVALPRPEFCPCKYETPDPCPACGATVAGNDRVNGVCQARR